MAYRAAIVGCAATTALGADLDATWAALARGESALAPWPDERAWDGRPPWVARLPYEHLLPLEDTALRVLGRHGEWLDLCARLAHDQARFGDLPRDQVGLFVALGMVDSPPEDLAPAVLASRDADGELDLAVFFGGGFRSVHPLWPLAMLANVAVGHVAIGLDLRGDNVVLGSEADAGGHAIGEAWLALALGSVKAALAGGAAESLSDASLVRRDLKRPLARAPQPPATGDVLGEGGAVLALEDPASAAARGVPVLGWIAGRGAAFGGAGGTGDAAAMRRALRQAAHAALASAGLALVDVDLVFLPWGLPPGPKVLCEPPTEGWLGEGIGCGQKPLTYVSLQGALGSLLGADPALAVAAALRAFADPRPLEGHALWLEKPRERPASAQRALVLAASAAGSVSAVLVEAPSCAS
jgi:3-oxoacyl-(acyl-carrier-protein) synthase